MEVSKIYKFIYTSILLLAFNTSYICDNSKLELVMRNNINGDFAIIKSISDIKAGAFININWNKKKLMLPLSLREDSISFTDKKWDWRYTLNKNGYPNGEHPTLYELLPSGEIKKHLCHKEEKKANV